MGQSSSKASKAVSPPTLLLLQASMEGDLAKILMLVAEYCEQQQQQQQQGQDNPCSNVAAAAATFLNTPTDDASSGKNTAMHGAIFAGHLAIVQYLHEQVGPESLLTPPNGLGCTPLWLAAGYNRLDILNYLLRHIPPHQLAEALLTTNSTGDTPLLAAASKGYVKICHCLLRAAVVADKNTNTTATAARMMQTTNQNRDSPLSVAIAAGIQDEALLKQLAGVESSSSSSSLLVRYLPNAKGITPLLVACEMDHVRAARILLPVDKTKVEASIVPTTAAAASNGSSVVVRSGDSPLGVAAFCGSVEVMKLLLSDQYYQSQLEASSPWSVNFTHPQTGCTPLFLAVRAGHVECARLLLDKGADAAIPNRQGLTPRQAAEKYGANPVLLDLLLSHSQQPHALTAITKESDPRLT